jgi:hypothetical protein
MRTKHVWLVVCFAVFASVGLWGYVASRFFKASPPPPPPARVVQVTGHASERITAPRLTWEVEICAAKGVLAERTREAVRRASKSIPAADLTVGKPENDGGGEDQQDLWCTRIDGATTQVAAAVAWQRSLVSSHFVDRDSAMDPECLGDDPVAATRSRVAMRAIADARAQADALLGGRAAQILKGIEASVTHDEGTWDERCERMVTADADLTLPTD